ncbi:MAG: efflux RND transporter periplasmic adaptor subunit [Thermodesulfovibrionales bacterium]
MKKALFAVAGILLIGAVVFALFRNKEAAPQFRTERIGRGAIQASVTATGTVNPVVNVQVGTQVSGTIKAIYADFNTQVAKGQLIVLIDPATFEAQVAQARANLLSARANLEKAEITRADAKRTLERNRELFKKGYIARSDVDTAETNHGTAVSQVSAAHAQVAQTEAALRTAEINLRYTRIVSPVEGTVVSRNVDVGQTVAASFQTPTLFTIARDLTRMQIDSNVAEADIGRVRVGQPAEFTVDAYPDVTFKGSVAQVRNAPITVQNVVTYDVVIKVDNSDLKLKPGMTANISLVVESKENVLRIPNAALRFRLPEEGRKGAERQRDKRKGVWVPGKDKPQRVKVATGISDGLYTELVSGELREGQEVIVESLAREKKPSMPSGPRMF